VAKFMIEFPHSSEECLDTMELLAQKNPDVLAATDWGCLVDKHTGWGIVEADNRAQIEAALPPDLNEKAVITEINRFDLEDIKSRHMAA